MPTATHQSAVSVSITLEPAPTAQAGLGNVLLLVPLATNNLNSEVVRSYENDGEAAADLTLGYISAGTREKLRVAFSQRPAPALVKVGSVDIVGGDGYDDALAEAIVADPDFYGVVIDSRVDASIIEISNACEALTKICVVQSDDASWLAAGLPAGLTGLAGNERTAVIYHDDDTDAADVAALCRFLAFDPDSTSAPFIGTLKEVPEIAALTTAQRNFIFANYANVGLAFGSADYFLKKGVNCANRPLEHIVSVDWFTLRSEADLATLIQAHADRGEKLTMDEVGQAKILGRLNTRLAQGVQAGHFVGIQDDGTPGTRLEAEDITSTDLTDQNLRFSGVLRLSQNTQAITVALNATTSVLE